MIEEETFLCTLLKSDLLKATSYSLCSNHAISEQVHISSQFQGVFKENLLIKKSLK